MVLNSWCAQQDQTSFLDLRSQWGSLNLCNQRWWRTSKKLWIHVPSSLPVLPYAQTALLRLQLAKFLEMTAIFCCANGMSYGKLHWNRKVNKPCPVSRYIPHLFLTSFPCWNNQTSKKIQQMRLSTRGLIRKWGAALGRRRWKKARCYLVMEEPELETVEED